MKPASAILLCTLLLAAACGRLSGATEQDAARNPNLDNLPSGDLAGGVRSTVGARIDNPLEGQPAAIAAGKTLFVKMNCAGCHAYDLSGSMGPNLKDRYWRYGGSPGEIYRSISGGHPQGMPAWGKALPPEQIWQLTAYIESFGGSTPAADYQKALQGDYAAKTTDAPGGTGAQAGAKGGSSPAAQPGNP